MTDEIEKSDDDANTPEEQPHGRRRPRLIHIPTPGPVKFLQNARRAAENLPFAGEAFKRLRETEDWAVTELKHRLDTIGEFGAPSTAEAKLGSAAKRLTELFRAAKQNGAQQARELMYLQVLEQMVPEQARMLAVVAQVEPTYMCHVDAGAPVGPVSRRVLAFATSAGKDAGIVLRAEVPRLMAHMVALGLVEQAPEVKNAKVHYEMLETEDSVRHAILKVKNEPRSWPRIQRHSLVLSEFGAALWHDVGPDLGATVTALGNTHP